MAKLYNFSVYHTRSPAPPASPPKFDELISAARDVIAATDDVRVSADLITRVSWAILEWLDDIDGDVGEAAS